MLNWLKSLFSKKDSGLNTSTKSNSTSLDVKIKINENFSFYPNLINNLKEDHKNIVAFYTNINNGFQESDADKIIKNLHLLNDLLRKHLLKEDNMLYMYLLKVYSNDVEKLKFVRGMKSEMSGLEPAVFGFLKKYSVITEWNDTFFSQLEEDMKGLTPVLVARITNEEEKLYSLYKNVSK